MECTEARTLMLDRRRGALDDAARAEVDGHLAGCEACRREDEADRELSSALEGRLARPRAPEALRRSLEERWDPASVPSGRRGGRTRARTILRAAIAMAAGAAIALLVAFAWPPRVRDGVIATEAVNDHLRVLYGEHPIEVESGGIHQVKPWFAGRLDFAPVVRFAGDDDFPLQGGAVAYFIDRKAAAFVFKRRLHVISLFVFRADGLPWPPMPAHAIGDVRGTLETSRGFHVLTWRQGDLGYALVSDVDERDLDALGRKIATGD